MTTDFDGYMLRFHCDYCGENFIVICAQDKSMPKHLDCPYCQTMGADRMYQDEKRQVVICYV